MWIHVTKLSRMNLSRIKKLMGYPDILIAFQRIGPLTSQFKISDSKIYTHISYIIFVSTPRIT